MKPGTLAAALSAQGLLATTIALAGVNPCPGRVPDYVLLGSEGMVLTSEAEELLCRSAGELEEWNDPVEEGAKIIVESRIVRASQFRAAVNQATEIDFRRCVFPDEIYVRDGIQSRLTFRQCEFQGNVVISGGEVMREVAFLNSVFHQGVAVSDVILKKPLTFAGSVLTGQVVFEDTLLEGGFRASGSRFAGRVHMVAVRTPVGFQLDGDRFLNTVEFNDLETGGAVRFRDSEFDRSGVVTFLGGTIGGGIRFDSCSFDGEWVRKGKEDVPLIRLADVTVGSSVVLATAASRVFPHLSVSRCIIPFLKLPEWRLAREMVSRGAKGPVDEDSMEDRAELLQLLRSSYETSGRTRDAYLVRKAHRLLTAEIQGGPQEWIWKAHRFFGTGLWWFLGIILGFALLFFMRGRKWKMVDGDASIGLNAYQAIDASVKGFWTGPGAKVSEFKGTKAARNALIVEHLLGLIFFFFLGIVLNEWLRG